MSKRRGHIGQVSDSLPNMLISPFFSGAVLYMTDQKDLNMLLNFWINEQAFIILFQCFNSMSGYRDISLQVGAQNEQKMIIFNEQNLIISIL